jgi:toxin-antitoxin system PIN domain toxin
VELVDTNVLLYAVNADAHHHDRSRRWLDGSLSGGGTVGLAWVVLLAFVRLSTKAEVFPRPLTPDQAMDVVDAWLSAPAAVVIEPTRDHARVLRRLLSEHGAGANLTSDAHLAALSIEHRCPVVSFDSDFGRFAGVDWRTPPG